MHWCICSLCYVYSTIESPCKLSFAAIGHTFLLVSNASTSIWTNNHKNFIFVSNCIWWILQSCIHMLGIMSVYVCAYSNICQLTTLSYVSGFWKLKLNHIYFINYITATYGWLSISYMLLLNNSVVLKWCKRKTINHHQWKKEYIELVLMHGIELVLMHGIELVLMHGIPWIHIMQACTCKLSRWIDHKDCHKYSQQIKSCRLLQLYTLRSTIKRCLYAGCITVLKLWGSYGFDELRGINT